MRQARAKGIYEDVERGHRQMEKTQRPTPVRASTLPLSPFDREKRKPTTRNDMDGDTARRERPPAAKQSRRRCGAPRHEALDVDDDDDVVDDDDDERDEAESADHGAEEDESDEEKDDEIAATRKKEAKAEKQRRQRDGDGKRRGSTRRDGERDPYSESIERLLEVEATREELERLKGSNRRLEEAVRVENEKTRALQRRLAEKEVEDKSAAGSERRKAEEYRTLYRKAQCEGERERRRGRLLRRELDRTRETLNDEQKKRRAHDRSRQVSTRDGTVTDLLLQICMQDDDDSTRTRSSSVPDKWKGFAVGRSRKPNMAWSELCKKIGNAVCNTLRRRQREDDDDDDDDDAASRPQKADDALKRVAESRELRAPFAEAVDKLIFYDRRKGTKGTSKAQLLAMQNEVVVSLENLATAVADCKERSRAPKVVSGCGATRARISQK